MVKQTPRPPVETEVAETYRKLLQLILKNHKKVSHGGTQNSN